MDPIAIVAVAATAAFAAIAAVMARRERRIRSDRALLAERGVAVPGRVEATGTVTVGRYGQTRHRATIAYTVDGVVHRRDETWAPSEANGIVTGAPVELLVDPTAPDRAQVTGAHTPSVVGASVWWGLTAFVAAVAAVVVLAT